ncbi:MAG: hypothetical protein GY731_10805, partial [Gammaproteobacteria bacterium]|nr:hypothetical protein [Gammaproteobacteria bacterium]
MCTHPLSYKTFHPIPSFCWGVPACRLFLSLAFLAVMASSVKGAELSLTPYANLQLRHDDNKRLTTAPHDAVTGRILDAKV